MKVNTNINLRNRSRVELKNFKGLDTLSSPVEVSSIHGMECENLISRDGVNHKRYGWKTKLRIGNGKINAIFSFKLGVTSYVIAYTGGDNLDNISYTHAFYSVSSNSASRISKVSDASGWTDDCKCFVNGDKAYFIGFGDFLVYDGTTLKKVIEDNPYIPTTTENIGSEEKGQHYTRITAEERNLLSPYVYNTLIGDSLYKGEIATYYLDTPNFDAYPLSLMINYDGSDSEKVYLSKSSKVERSLYGKGMKIEDKLELSLEDWDINLIGKNFIGNITKELHLPSTATLIEFENGYSIKAFFKQTVKLTSTGLQLNGETYYPPEKVEARIVLYNNDAEIRNLYIGNDAVNDYKEVSMSYKTSVVEGNVETTWNIKFEGWNKIYLFYKDNNYLGASEELTNIYIKNLYYGDWIGCTEKWLDSIDEGYTGQYNAEKGIIRLHYNKNDTNVYKPKVDGKPNIQVQIGLPNKTNDNYIQVTKATNGIKFGLGGSDDRLFLTNDNVVMWSKDEDFTYFGEKSWCLCGTKETKIKDLDRLNDSTLLLVKEYSVREPSVYVISGVLNQGVTEGGTIDYTAIFTPKGYQVGMGAVGELTNFNGDCLMVCKDGVYSVSLGENMTVDARYIHHRSRQITNELSKYDLSKAKTISFDGKYYLAIDGKCYVADNKYLASFKGDMQNVPNYEWWKWTNMPVNCWGYVDNELCFGTLDSEICVFTDKFYDEELLGSTRVGNVSYKFNDKNEIIGFTTSQSVNLEGEIIKPNSSFYIKLETKNFEVEEGKVKLYLPLNEYNDLEYIYIDGLLKTLTKKDTYMELTGYVPGSDTIVFYKNMQDKILRVKKHETEDYYQFIYQDKIVYGDKVNGGLNPSQISFSMNTYKKTPIVAKWITGALDLGTRSHAKTLTKLVMTGEKDLANHLKYGIKTRVTNRNYEFLRANNDLDFENLDLETLSLDSQFASSFVKRLNLRNVNFIQLYLMSDTEEDMAINSIELEYKIIKNNIGVN